MNQNEVYQTRVVIHPKTTRKSGAVQTGVSTSTKTAVQTRRAPRPVGKMMLFGAVSLAAYVYLFANESLVTNTFTLGGWHAAFPVVTAFFFSFIHGAFASNLLSVLGLEAKKKAVAA